MEKKTSHDSEICDLVRLPGDAQAVGAYVCGVIEARSEVIVYMQSAAWSVQGPQINNLLQQINI